MSDLVLATLNAKYIHASLGLRYLHANLGELASRCSIEEFVIHDRPVDVAERLLAGAPQLIGLGVYVWNAQPTLELVRILKRVAPQVAVVLGGPEVRYEQAEQELCALADWVIAGEADLQFAALCRQVLAGDRPPKGVIQVRPPALDAVALPYQLYSAHDLQHRVIYVEASRGCPYQCEFCLSSMDDGVRRFDTAQLLGQLEALIARGARTFKFVDRTFNLDLKVTTEILQFFLKHAAAGVFAHFELVPDRLPDDLKALIARFPEGALQFEVGIQTWDLPTAARISRRQDYAKTEANLAFLKAHTGVHLHTDLIVGLPGETRESFGRGFDRLVALCPHEIQVGILKRLRGTPIIRHDAEWAMVYSPQPPYELLSSRTLDFHALQQLKRFARAWDLVANSGRYQRLCALLLGQRPSAFEAFGDFTAWLHQQVGDFVGLAPERLSDLLVRWLSSQQLAAPAIEQAQLADAQARAQTRLEQRARQRSLRRQSAHQQGGGAIPAAGSS